MRLPQPMNQGAMIEAGQQLVDMLAAGQIRRLQGILGKQNHIGRRRPDRAMGFVAPLIHRVAHPVARVFPR